MIAKDNNLRISLPEALLDFVELRAGDMGYQDVADYVRSLIEADQAFRSQVASSKGAAPLLQAIQAISAGVPESEWAKVPVDLSKHLDHHLYGAPRED